MKSKYPFLSVRVPKLQLWALFICLSFSIGNRLSSQDLPNPSLLYSLTYELPDSIEETLNSTHGATAKASYLLQQIEHTYATQSNLALFLVEEALPYAKGGRQAFQRAQLRYWKAKILSWNDPESEQLQVAIAEAQNALYEFDQKEEALWLAKTHNLIALIYFYQDQYSFAASEIEKSFSVFETLSNIDMAWQEVRSEALRIKGNILLYRSTSIDSTLSLYRESQAFYLEIKDSLKLATLLLNQGIVLADFDTTADLRIHASAEQYYLEAISIYKRKNSEEDLAVSYLEYATYLADIFWNTEERNDFLHSNTYLHKALELQPDRTCELYYQLASNYQSMASWNKDKSINNKLLLDTAALLYEKTMDRAILEENLDYFKSATSSIKTICPYLKNARCSALLEVMNSNYEKILGAVLQVKDTVSTKNLAYRDELAEREQRQILTWTGGSALGILATISFLYYRSRLKSLNKALENKMEALRAQMNPHFISNSLNAIDSLINQERNDEASEYIIDFSRLCRLVLNNSKEKWITLEEEIETLAYFINLEKLRLGENLTYNIDVDDDLNQTDIQIPPMLLQPFVENAIWHGIQKKQAPGHLEVTIFKNEAGLLECHITDDGIGRKKAMELQKESILEHQSWGMTITKERMESVKKMKDSTLEITDFNPDDPMPGTKVCIKLPLLLHKSN